MSTDELITKLGFGAAPRMRAAADAAARKAAAKPGTSKAVWLGVGALLGLGIAAFFYWLYKRSDFRFTPDPMQNTRASKTQPPPVPTHREYMFKRPKMKPFKKTHLKTSDDFGGYYGAHPRGFSQDEERMKRKTGQKNSYLPKTNDKMKNNYKNIKPGIYNTGHIEQVGEINSATNISAGNNFVSAFGRNSGDRNISRYIQPLESRGVSSDALNFASITK
tara:strand:- start:11881 stop:12540 length:660 start_codon:yes stop_codon:yes gene_type:complete